MLGVKKISFFIISIQLPYHFEKIPINSNINHIDIYTALAQTIMKTKTSAVPQNCDDSEKLFFCISRTRKKSK